LIQPVLCQKAKLRFGLVGLSASAQVDGIVYCTQTLAGDCDSVGWNDSDGA
jgi:hypothetical protein